MPLPKSVAEENIDRGYICNRCNDETVVDVLGDTGTHGWDVVDVKKCPECTNEE